MKKTKMFVIRLTAEQDRKLEEHTRLAGFAKKSEYVRSTLFRDRTMEEKIDLIYKMVVCDE